jgi:pectate lyase
VIKAKNVIIRNIKISKVKAPTDAVAVQAGTNVWIDHMDLSSDLNHGKDYYDGLCDITHGSDFITVSNTKFHDHFKGSLVGHSDSNGKEDTGHLRVTYHHNHWENIHSRAPMIRFGTLHSYNSQYVNVDDGVNVRDGAQALVENSVWGAGSTSKTSRVSQDSSDSSADSGSSKGGRPIFSADSKGYAVSKGNVISGGKDTAPVGKLTKMPYRYTLVPAGQVATVVEVAGANLKF